MQTHITHHKVYLYPSRQKGSTLLIGMIFLLILTSLTVYSASQAIQQEKLSGHYIEKLQSFHRTESLLSALNIQLSPLVDTLHGNAVKIGEMPKSFSKKKETEIGCTADFLNEVVTGDSALMPATKLGFDMPNDNYTIVHVNGYCIGDAYELSRAKSTGQYYWVVVRSGIESKNTLYSLFSVWGS